MASSINNQIAAAFDRALDGLAVVESVDGDDAADVVLRAGTVVYRLRAVWAGAGWPADVERAVSAIRGGWPDDLVVVARRLSPGARESLEERGASWLDWTGAARIAAGGLLILRDAPPDSGARERAFSWSPSAVSVAEALLARDSPSGVRTADLAALTGWSASQVSQVLGAFDAEGWTAKWGPQRGAGASREIVDAPALLEAWADEVASTPAERRFAERIFSDPVQFLAGELGPTLDAHGILWAITGWAAGEQLAPFTTNVPSLQVYVEDRAFRGPLTQAMRAVPVREVESGGRVEFRAASSRVLDLAARHNDIPVASTPRVYADMRALGGRGEDAAGHLRNEVILPRLRPRERRPLSAELDAWDRACRDRLKRRITQELGGAASVYGLGSWSVSYAIPGVTLSLPELRDALAAVEGNETGWPPWWVPTRDGIRPEVHDGGLEVWFRDDAVRNHGHADFWRAEPGLRLFLLRGYQEDGITGAPGSALDPVLPVWRAAECLLHAARLARHVKADKIEFLSRWEGLENRELRSVAGSGREISPGYVAHTDSIATFVRSSPGEIDTDLPSVVRALVSPLFEVFGLFTPPGSLYASEITAMLKRHA